MFKYDERWKSTPVPSSHEYGSGVPGARARNTGIRGWLLLSGEGALAPVIRSGLTRGKRRKRAEGASRLGRAHETGKAHPPADMNPHAGCGVWPRQSDMSMIMPS